MIICATVELSVWNSTRPVLVCETCDSFLTNKGNDMVVEKICEALVSDSPKDLMISRTSEGFILNIRDHLSIQKTCESSLLNKRRHLVFAETCQRFKTDKRDKSHGLSSFPLKLRGTRRTIENIVRLWRKPSENDEDLYWSTKHAPSVRLQQTGKQIFRASDHQTTQHGSILMPGLTHHGRNLSTFHSI